MGRVHGIRDHYTRCPFPVSGGGDCWEEPHPASRHGLCKDHWREVVEDWVSDAPRTTRSCPRCFADNWYEVVDWSSASCGRCGASMDAPWLITEHHQIQRAAADLEPSAPGVVYYVQFVDLVKIGFSTNLRQRMLVIPHDKILATEPGSITLERSRHRQFADLMVAGQREWFRAAPELLDHAASLRAEHGDPDQVASAIQSGWSDAEIMRQYGGPERLAAEIDALSH